MREQAGPSRHARNLHESVPVKSVLVPLPDRAPRVLEPGRATEFAVQGNGPPFFLDALGHAARGGRAIQREAPEFSMI